jgi:hypothetical protein
MSHRNPTLKQRGASKEMLQVLRERDRNTRGIAKVVSAWEYVLEGARKRHGGGCIDKYEGECLCVLLKARGELVAARRGISARLLVEMAKLPERVQ